MIVADVDALNQQRRARHRAAYCAVAGARCASRSPASRTRHAPARALA
jgi:hypothetical protein